MINKKRTTFIAVITGMLMAFAIAAPISSAATFDPSSPDTWMEGAKSPKDPDSIYPYTLHDDLPPSGISYSGYDETKTNIILGELEKYAKAPDKKNPAAFDAETAVPLLVDSLLEETDKLYTQYELLNIEYYRDVNNDKISKQTNKIYEDNIAITDRCLQVLRDVLKGPNGKILKKKLTKNQRKFLAEYEDMTKKEKRLYKEESDLVQEYDKLILNSKDYKKDNKDFVRIYTELIGIRNELAKCYGYENYPDYSYGNIYYRDYSCDDAKALYKTVKEHIVPLFIESSEKFYDSDYFQLLYYGDKGDVILKSIAPYISKVDPELKESFNYLRRHHTYDLDYSPSKMDIGYTVDLPQYGAMYIFNSPYGEAVDYSVTIHEFGHYNAGFHQRQHAIFTEPGSIDIAEIQSQGLELLFLDYYDEIFGESSDVVELETMTNILSGVVTGCMYDEFQQEIFDHPDMTRNEINKLGARLAKEYGMIDARFLTKETAPYDWVAISHNYESPMYYISYATSALSALDIWAQSLEDRDAAIDKYMEITTVKTDVPYLKGIKKCGLKNVFNEATIKYIAGKIKKNRFQ